MMSTKFVTLRLGIKKNIIDGLLIHIPLGSKTAMITTKNKFAASPVVVSRENIKSGIIKYIFINSGNANACTGTEGHQNTKQILHRLSERLNCSSDQILIMSTGIIGRQLPIKKIIESITNSNLNIYSNIKKAASAIMTTDKFPKYLTKTYKIGSKNISFRGICKGAGMIEPNMATMLSFIETNVDLSKTLLKKYLKYCANLSFNSISVDGDMSTNDSVVFSSTGNIKLNMKNKSTEEKFLSCASDFFIRLASLIVKDGEGATKFIKLSVINVKSLVLAQEVSKKLSRSILVKTAMFGEDPNWGRIIASIGSIESSNIKPDKIKLRINNILCFKNGISFDNVSRSLEKSMRKNTIEIIVDLNNGKQKQTMFFCDLSHDYVRINSEYTT
ncbi:MAG: bifunctional glutamate N-acetyltransferase/amino-acid acetyltransferase ArgJ [Pseudomonadota bacterium]|nr:bifunctional glutamate N-acetyltransferase/amino-acid acetyltransferase ArgJ [Pseudomonadota bacterium]